MGAAPFQFVCPVARRNREGVWSGGNVPSYPKGHDRIVRTGRTKPRPVDGKRSTRNLPDRHEYRCECGHVGWSAHAGIIRFPVVDACGGCDESNPARRCIGCLHPFTEKP